MNDLLVRMIEQRLEEMAIQAAEDQKIPPEHRYGWVTIRHAKLRFIATNVIAELVASRVRYQEEPGRSVPYTLNSRGEINEVWPSTMEGELADPEDGPHSPSWHAQALQQQGEK